MQHQIKIAASLQEREAIYRFRYRVYMEEMNKHHIPADHENKMLFDEADLDSILYYARLDDKIVATVRLKRGSEILFTKKEQDFFYIEKFEQHINVNEISITDRLIVDIPYRHSSLTPKMMLRTYLGGLEGNIKICFITCDDKLLQMYLRYGFRIYDEPATLPTGEKRNRLVLFLCDKEHLQKSRSPFLPHLPESLDDKGYYAALVKEKLGLKLIAELNTAA